jgi:hypothetical protein
MFTAYPSYNPYRNMRFVRDRLMRGEDVYALQIAVKAVGAGDLAIDGIFGQQTKARVRSAQEILGLYVDGVAGPLTQRALALRFLARHEHMPYLLGLGQLTHESGCLLGNYSAKRADGSYDAGVAQRNTNYTDPRLGFNPVESISALTLSFEHHYVLFDESDISEDRRLALAAGAWNAPAFACYYAGVRPWAVPSPAAADAFQHYLDSITAYL